MIEVPIGSIVLFAIALILTIIFAIKQGEKIKEQSEEIFRLNEAFISLLKIARKNNEK